MLYLHTHFLFHSSDFSTYVWPYEECLIEKYTQTHGNFKGLKFRDIVTDVCGFQINYVWHYNANNWKIQ
jgi:hypothetical protein